jgi:hypothetical protein
MQILVINNDGSGFADFLEVETSTTVQQLFDKQVANPKPENYLIRVNRLPTSRDQILNEGDRVSFTPRKIEGAA